MAIELLSYPIREASSAGLISIEHFNRAFSNQTWTLDRTEATVSKFRKVTPEPNRTGHARFRRAPVQPQSHSQESNPVQTFGSVSPKIDFSAVPGKDCGGLSASTSGRSSSTISGEGSVSNGKGGSISPLVFQAPARSSGKPPLPGKRYREHDLSGCRSGETSGCHCGKRKHTAKRTIRVAAISSSVADIPADDYSWRKYGQKPIKGSTFPRGYYRCSAARECPARKHVERANDDPNVLIVTYEGMHCHTLGAKQVIIPTVRG